MPDTRPPILEYYSAVVDSSRRWYRRHVNRESVIDWLKTFIWVAPLTVLIWVYAEQEQEATDGGQIAVSVHSADPNRIARLGPMADEWVLVDLKGPRSRIEAVKRQLSSVTVPIEVPSSYPLGEVHLATESYVQNAPVFVNNGVKVQNVRPKTITVVVDTLSDTQIPVTAQDPSRLSSAVFEPRVVNVRGPTQVIDTARREGKLVVQADLSRNPELSRPGLHEKVTVPIMCPIEAIPFVVVTPRQVQATINVLQAAKEHTIGQVPVWVEGPPAFLAGVDVNCESFVFNVKVSGPADQIQQIIDQKVLPHATLSVTSEDPLNMTRSKPLTFNNLPPDVKVSKADLEKPFDFKIVPKVRTPG